MAAYYITGIAGSGKSTIASELRENNLNVIDIDAVEGLCHWRHKETGDKATYFTGVGKDWLDAHDRICDSSKLRKLLDDVPNSVVVVVGIASNQEDYLQYFDQTFLLYCSEKTFLKRLNTRNDGNNFGKNKSEQEQILTWYKDFQERMINLGAIPINTEKPLGYALKKIKDSF